MPDRPSPVLSWHTYEALTYTHSCLTSHDNGRGTPTSSLKLILPPAFGSCLPTCNVQGTRQKPKGKRKCTCLNILVINQDNSYVVCSHPSDEQICLPGGTAKQVGIKFWDILNQNEEILFSLLPFSSSHFRLCPTLWRTLTCSSSFM